MTLEFPATDLKKKSQIWNFMETRPLGTELFQADARADG